MSEVLVATYANGVFVPDHAVDLPENKRVKLTLETVDDDQPKTLEPGSDEAWNAYLQHLKESTFSSREPRPTREELYEDF